MHMLATGNAAGDVSLFGPWRARRPLSLLSESRVVKCVRNVSVGLAEAGLVSPDLA